jgi:hypothetical protein
MTSLKQSKKYVAVVVVRWRCVVDRIVARCDGNVVRNKACARVWCVRRGKGNNVSDGCLSTRVWSRWENNSRCFSNRNSGCSQDSRLRWWRWLTGFFCGQRWTLNFNRKDEKESFFIYWPATTHMCLHENSLLRAFLEFEVVKEIILIFNRPTSIVRRSALGSLWLQSRAIPATHLRTCKLKAFFPSSHQTSYEQHAEKCRSTGTHQQFDDDDNDKLTNSVT